MPRKARHQTGTVFQKIREGKKIWHGQYTDADGKRPVVPLPGAKTKSEARTALAAKLAPINQARADKHDPNISLAAFTESVYIPFGKKKWKGSTAIDTPGRLRKHVIGGEMGAIPIMKLDRETMQAFLNARSAQSASLVSHLRFDLRALLRLAAADGFVARNQAEALYTPRACKKKGTGRVLTFEQIHELLGVLDLRERLFCRIAIFSGCRPGEIIAMKWASIDGATALVTERIYRGVTDTPKNDRPRDAELTDEIMVDLSLWRRFSGDSEFNFPSEGGTTAIWYQNLWRRHIRPRLKKIGLEWADFRCMRRTNASLMHEHKIDTKAGAAQRGHDVGVSINEYTQISREDKRKAVAELERMFKLSAPRDQASRAGQTSTRATGARP